MGTVTGLLLLCVVPAWNLQSPFVGKTAMDTVLSSEISAAAWKTLTSALNRNVVTGSSSRKLLQNQV